MKKALLFVLALIAVGCAEPILDLEEMRALAEQGDANAQNNLGFMYVAGDGVPEDNVLAYMWYNLAAAQENEVAQVLKDFIEEEMTREQIAEGQRLSREWLEAHPSGN
jgi:hypothetical protein